MLFLIFSSEHSQLCVWLCLKRTLMLFAEMLSSLVARWLHRGATPGQRAEQDLSWTHGTWMLTSSVEKMWKCGKQWSLNNQQKVWSQTFKSRLGRKTKRNSAWTNPKTTTEVLLCPSWVRALPFCNISLPHCLFLTCTPSTPIQKVFRKQNNSAGTTLTDLHIFCTAVQEEKDPAMRQHAVQGCHAQSSQGAALCCRHTLGSSDCKRSALNWGNWEAAVLVCTEIHRTGTGMTVFT